MDRETKELVLKKSGKKIITRAYLTENESREMSKTLTTSDDVKQDAETLFQFKDKVIESWVIEFDGSDEKINERMKELPSQDYNQVMTFVKELNSEEEEKKIS